MARVMIFLLAANRTLPAITLPIRKATLSTWRSLHSVKNKEDFQFNYKLQPSHPLLHFITKTPFQGDGAGFEPATH
jgi:hypothetical protein